MNILVRSDAAKKRGESIDHVLLYGPPGLGKTTMANVIAREMGANIRITSGPAIEKAGDLASIVTNLQDGDILFIDEKEKAIRTTFGTVHYDELILAAGATTNFFGNAHFEHDTLPMKTVDDAIHLRNTILERLEMAETEDNPEHRQAFMNIVIVGGGPSGVEIAGALAEMKRTVLPRDYADLDASQMHIYLVNAADRLLSTMDKASSEKAEKGLKELGVEIMNNCMAMDYTNSQLILKDHTPLTSKTVIWVSGIKANTIGGIPSTSIGRGARILVDRYNRVKGMQDVYAIGDQCLVEGDELYPYGHPQLAQVAIQQAANVAANIERLQNDKPMRLFPFSTIRLTFTGKKRGGDSGL